MGAVLAFLSALQSVLLMQSAAAATEAVHLAVEASCANAVTMAARISKRTALQVAGPEDSEARTLHFEISPFKGGARGSFWVEDAAGEASMPRNTSGSTCRVVAEQLALMAALALRTSGGVSLPPEQPDGRPVLQSAQDMSWYIEGLEALEEPMHPPNREPWSWGAGMSFRVDSALQSHKPGLGLHLQAVAPTGAWGRLALQWSTYTGAGPSIQWWRGELLACPLRQDLSVMFAVSPCGLLRAGVIAPGGREFGVREWTELGAVGELEAQLGAGFELALGAGLAVPMSRPQFATSQSVSPPAVFRTSPLQLVSELVLTRYF